MVTFIVDTPAHKEWILPDGRHHMITSIYGNTHHWSIRDHATFGNKPTKESGYLDLDHPQYQEHWELVQELANKKYKKPLQGTRGEFRYKAGL